MRIPIRITPITLGMLAQAHRAWAQNNLAAWVFTWPYVAFDFLNAEVQYQSVFVCIDDDAAKVVADAGRARAEYITLHAPQWDTVGTQTYRTINATCTFARLDDDGAATTRVLRRNQHTPEFDPRIEHLIGQGYFVVIWHGLR